MLRSLILPARLAWLAAGLGLLVAPSAASAESIAAEQAFERTCFDRRVDGAAGTVTRRVTAEASGLLNARLSAGGDWDVAVFDADSGRTVAAAAGFGADELAQGIVSEGQQLVVQACRQPGAGARASLDVRTEQVSAPDAGGYRPKQVFVAAPTRARRQQLADLGLDLTEHGSAAGIDVVLHRRAEEEQLRRAGFQWVVRVADLAARDRADRREDRAYARAVPASGLPSGRTTYRRLFEYESDLKQLVAERPDLVKPITLRNRTWEGRRVMGVEITREPGASDGKPVFLQLGAHHAREWPSSEHALEWAFQLVRGYDDDERTRRLVDATRTIVVPIVNPDGFNLSREAGEVNGAGGGRAGNEPQNIATWLATGEYKRKNCRDGNSDRALCTGAATGLGTDPNRNYAGFWGGPGAGTTLTDETYRGPAPFSEPETRNVREFVSRRQVTTLISNHTFSNLVLRPPGLASEGPPPDEDRGYKALGDAMAAANGYASQYGYQLYDTTGSTDDWSYYATGGFGYTFEVGPSNFHPPFADVVAEWEGTSTAAAGGNRGAYYLAQESTADPARHSLLAGRAPAGATLRLRKSFLTETSPVVDELGREGERRSVRDTLDSTLLVGRDGAFSWHVNPSTRPIVARDRGRAATGSPSASQTFAEAPPDEVSCQDAAFAPTPPPTCYEDNPITIPGAPADNGRASIRIDWGAPTSDYDMAVYRRGSDGALTPVGVSGQGDTTFEQVILADPAPGEYVARVFAYEAPATDPWAGEVTFAGPEPFRPARKETWRLTCERPRGRVREARDVLIERGERQDLDLSC
ncbi:MAG: zinc carboxypeptidase [Thermoleophilaceae bacterium]|nr:zinc carboxypeptidase [Thermoleophilaceae bacterium]